MAIAGPVTQNVGSGVSSAVQAVAVTATTAGNFLIAIYARSGGLASGQLTSVVDSAGQAWSMITRGAASGGTNTRVEIWYRANSASITSITFTSATAQSNSWNVTEWSGVATATPVDVASPDGSSNLATATQTTPSITTLNPNDLVITGLHFPRATTTDPGAPWSLLTNFDDTTIGSGRAAYQIVSATGSFSATWVLGTAKNAGEFTVSLAGAVATGTAVGVADTGAGFDDTSVSVTLAVADEPLTGIDAVAVGAAVAVTDVGAGTDTLVASTALTLADVGTGADQLAVAVPVAATDVSVASDSVSVAATVALSDPRTSVEAVTVAASTALVDAGVGVDALVVAVPIAMTDAGGGIEALTLKASSSITDTASAVDALSVGTSTVLTDAGTVTDAVSVVQGAIPVAVSDTSVAVDAIAVGAATGIADTCTTNDTLSVVVFVSLTDSCVGVDTSLVLKTISLTDLVAASETISVSNMTVITSSSGVMSNVDGLTATAVGMVGAGTTASGGSAASNAMSGASQSGASVTAVPASGSSMTKG